MEATANPARDARRAADNQIRPRLIGVIGARPVEDLADGPGLAVPAQLAEGQLVWVQGTGRLRRGVVTRVMRTRVEVAYTTANSAGRVYRVTRQLEQTRIDSEAPRTPAPAQADAELAPGTKVQNVHTGLRGTVSGVWSTDGGLVTVREDATGVTYGPMAAGNWAPTDAHPDRPTDWSAGGPLRGQWVAWDAKELVHPAGTGVVTDPTDLDGWVQVQYHTFDYRGWPVTNHRRFAVAELRPADPPQGA